MTRSNKSISLVILWDGGWPAVFSPSTRALSLLINYRFAAGLMLWTIVSHSSWNFYIAILIHSRHTIPVVQLHRFLFPCVGDPLSSILSHGSSIVPSSLPASSSGFCLGHRRTPRIHLQCGAYSRRCLDTSQQEGCWCQEAPASPPKACWSEPLHFMGSTWCHPGRHYWRMVLLPTIDIWLPRSHSTASSS
jgi:hypothetical protein